MSKSSPIPFKPLDFDTTRAAVERVTQAHNIPSLSFPKELPGRGGENAAPTPTVAPEPIIKRRPTKVLKVALPLAVVTLIKQRMLADGVTQQYVLMKALQKGGLPIADEDLIEDGRRDR